MLNRTDWVSVIGVSVCVICCVRQFVAQNPATQEALAGYATPTLIHSPGSQSTDNGNPEPTGDSFELDQFHFEEPEGNDSGLGPLYNATSCAACHQNPVTGGGSQITELRAGHIDHNGDFVNPTIWIDNGRTAIVDRSLVNDRAICPQAQERLTESENIRSLRIASSLLGDGYVEAVPDETLIALAKLESEESGGKIMGEFVMVPILEAPGTRRVGRFGWKDQHASLLSFSAEAYLDEIGLTSRLEPTDTTTVCKTGDHVEDTIDDIGMADVDHFVQFIRGTRVPPRASLAKVSEDVQIGTAIFTKIGCEICHVSTLRTSPPGTMLNDRSYVVSEAIGNKVFHPYSDFLLHDIGTGDGIVQNGPQDSANKIRTAPLWGLRARDRYLHDGHALTLEDAIREHSGESKEVIEHYKSLSKEEQASLKAFLASL